MYRALYRKWRPRTFDDVVGQRHITETLKRQLVAGRLSHAYLFVGTRGTGKTTCAKLLARAVNCLSPENGNPCNKCPSCLGIESGAVLDVEELDAASNNGVDNIRALRDEAVFTPAAVKKRVYIVDEVHMLSTAAFNALLKILEEPPEHLIFILATTELQKVPATILSRCQRFSFKRITTDDSSARLRFVAEQEGIMLTEGASHLLARLADGSMRDALSLLDQCAASAETVDEGAVYAAVGLAGALDTANMLSLIEKGDAEGALELFDRLYFGGKDPVGFLNELCSLCRDILVSELAPKNGGGLQSGAYAPDVIASFAKKLKKPTLMRYMTALQEAVQSASRSADRRICAEICIVYLSLPETADDIPALCARIERLESGGIVAPAAVKTDSTPAQVTETEPSADEVPWLDEIPEQKPVFSEPEPPAAEKPSESIVSDIVKEAKGALTPPQRMTLTSSDNVEIVFSDGVLNVFVKNKFADSMLNSSNVTSALKSAAERISGAPCRVNIADYVAKPCEGVDMLDSLGRFANVKFE